MSTLLLDEMYTGVVVNQPIKINRDTSIAHIRPWIYKHGTLPNGQFKLTILQGVTELKSSLIDFADINDAMSLAYAHGFIRFDFDNFVLYVEENQLETEYILRFEVINYTNDSSNFLAMSRRYTAKTYATYGDMVENNEAPNDNVEPFGLEIYEFKLRR